MGKYSNVKPEAKVIPFAQNGDYFYQKGIRAYRKRDLYKARKWLQRAEAMKPDNASILCQLAIVLTELGEYQRSNDYLQNIVNGLAPDMYDCHYFMANNYAFLGLFQEARKHAEAYLEKEPDGEFLEDTEDLLDLLEIEVDDMTDLEDDQDQLIVMQENAKGLLETGQFDEAIKLLKQIIAEYPQFWSAYNNLALAHFYKGNSQKASQVIEEILEKNPGNLHALCNLLVFYYREGRWEEVDALADRLEKVKPILMEHRYKLGATLGMIGRYEVAYKWLRSLQKNGFQGDSTFYYWLSISAYYVEKQTVAEQAWDKLVELDPEKKGAHPWREEEAESVSDKVGEILTYIFFTSVSKNDKDRERAFSFMQREMDTLEQPPVIQEYMEYAAHKKKNAPTLVKNGYAIAQLYYSKTLKQPLIMDWHTFLVRVHQSDAEVSFKNQKAIAAAFVYRWYKESSTTMSQKEAAALFDVSVSTVQKYSKELEAIDSQLDKQ